MGLKDIFGLNSRDDKSSLNIEEEADPEVDLDEEKTRELLEKQEVLNDIINKLGQEMIRHKNKKEDLEKRYDDAEQEGSDKIKEVQKQMGLPEEANYRFSPPTEGDPVGQLILISDEE